MSRRGPGEVPKEISGAWMPKVEGADMFMSLGWPCEAGKRRGAETGLTLWRRKRGKVSLNRLKDSRAVLRAQLGLENNNPVGSSNATLRKAPQLFFSAGELAHLYFGNSNT